MTYGCETSHVKRISLFARDSRDLREMRDGRRFEVRSSRFEVFGTSNPCLRPSAFGLRIAPVAHALLVSLTIHEQRGDSQAGC